MRISIDRPPVFGRLTQTGMLAKKAIAQNAVKVRPLAPALRLDLWTVWRSALDVCAGRARAITLFAAIGLIGALILGSAATSATQLVKEVVSTGHWNGQYAVQSLPGVIYERVFWVSIAAMGAGTVLIVFARGAIAHGSIYTSQGPEGLTSPIGLAWSAGRMALKRLPGLLCSTCLYGALVTASAVGLMLSWSNVHISIPIRFGLRTKSYLDVDTLLAQSAQQLVSDPAAPGVAWVPELSNLIWARDLPVTNRDPYYMAFQYTERYDDTLFTYNQAEFWVITSASLMALVAVELGLRFRTVASIASPDRHALSATLDGVGLAVRQAGPLAAHVAVFRLVTLLVSVLLVILPTVLVQAILLPRLHTAVLDWVSWVDWQTLRSLTIQITTLCAVAIGVCINVFGVVYDARLWTVLTSGRSVTPVSARRSRQSRHDGD